LHRLIGVLMRRLAAVVINVQRLVDVMVVVHLLRVHNHVDNDFFLLINVHRGQPSECLPEDGNQQKECLGSASHGRIVKGTTSQNEDIKGGKGN